MQRATYNVKPVTIEILPGIWYKLTSNQDPGNREEKHRTGTGIK